MFIIVGYYTPNYKNVAEKYLISSVKKLGLSSFIIPIDSMKTWVQNTNFKPIFIRQCLELFKNDIVYIDVDATVNCYPEEFDVIPDKYILAVHNFEWKFHYTQHQNSDFKQIASGTIFFRNNNVKNNEKSIDICNKWAKQTETVCPDQFALEKIIKKDNIEYYNLNRKYCYIETQPNGSLPIVPIFNPVITHYQFSRK